MNENKAFVEFIALPQNEAFARMVSAAFISSFDPTMEEVTEIKTAVSEAVSNSVIHGYGNSGKGNIRMELSSNENGLISIIIEDDGIGIDDISLARMPLFTTGDKEERSGMGFTVMESFMDKVIVKSETGKGTRITLIKSLDIISGL